MRRLAASLGFSFFLFTFDVPHMSCISAYLYLVWTDLKIFVFWFVFAAAWRFSRQRRPKARALSGNILRSAICAVVEIPIKINLFSWHGKLRRCRKIVGNLLRRTYLARLTVFVARAHVFNVFFQAQELAIQDEGLSALPSGALVFALLSVSRG